MLCFVMQWKKSTLIEVQKLFSSTNICLCFCLSKVLDLKKAFQAFLKKTPLSFSIQCFYTEMWKLTFSIYVRNFFKTKTLQTFILKSKAWLNLLERPLCLCIHSFFYIFKCYSKYIAFSQASIVLNQWEKSSFSASCVQKF